MNSLAQSFMDNVLQKALPNMLPLPIQQMYSVGQQPIVQQGLSQMGNEVAKQLPGEFSFLQSKEGANNSYDTRNAAGSSAYGKYQFMPSTAKMYAQKIGIDPNQWQLPQNQEAIMKAAQADYSRSLAKHGLQVTPANQYALHQMGTTGGLRVLKNKPTPQDIKNMNDNLPENLRASNPQTIVANWKNKYLQ